MAESTSKVPVRTEKANMPSPQAWRPFENLRREIERVFEDFDSPWRPLSRRSFWDFDPFRQMPAATVAAMPAVDVTETDKAYEVSAELPGMDEKNIEVKVANGVLTIKGEKHDEKEEKKKDYYLRERNYGSFQRSFQIPEGVDTDKIEANFTKGVLTVSLPKSAETQKAEKKITVKAA